MATRCKYTTKEIDLMARLMKAEAIGEGNFGMLLVGNVIINRVVATCDVFKYTDTITEVIYQKNAFAGVGTPLFNGPANGKILELAVKNLRGYRAEPANDALWFNNPGLDKPCSEEFYGVFEGRFKNHCFYQPEDPTVCRL